MKIEAKVKKNTGSTKNYVVARLPLNPLESFEFPPADRVEIVENDDGFFLFRYANNNEFAGDSWFESIDECKRQAKVEFGIEEADWEQKS